jgi:hypothetical protein
MHNLEVGVLRGWPWNVGATGLDSGKKKSLILSRGSGSVSVTKHPHDLVTRDLDQACPERSRRIAAAKGLDAGGCLVDQRAQACPEFVEGLAAFTCQPCLHLGRRHKWVNWPTSSW